MKLIIEVRRGTDEHWRDVRELRHEMEVGWDANGGDYVQALASFMFARTFCPETIVEAFRDYVDEWDGAHENLDEEWDDFYENTEESGAAEAGEKTAPDA